MKNSDIRLTILGNNGTCPSAQGACSSYLIEVKNYKIVMDLGNGSLVNLQKCCSLEEIDVVILSHLHFDHMGDLFLLKYALETKQARGKTIKMPILLTPSMPKWMEEEIRSEKVFTIDEINDGYAIDWNGIGISFCKVPHLIPSYAVRIAYKGKSIVYSSDTGYNTQLIEFAKVGDIFLCESTLVRTEIEVIGHHLSATQAGYIAREAEVKQLVLTHLWMDYEIEDYLKEARKSFEAVKCSEILKVYEV